MMQDPNFWDGGEPLKFPDHKKPDKKYKPQW